MIKKYKGADGTTKWCGGKDLLISKSDNESLLGARTCLLTHLVFAFMPVRIYENNGVQLGRASGPHPQTVIVVI
eukprot:7656316-Alexandrium_andersonii.AAC.1